MSRSLVSFRLADDLKLALKERANTEGISITELVNRLLRQGLTDECKGISSEDRLSVLESTVQHLLRMLEFEQLKRETFFRTNSPSEERLTEIEEKLQQIASDFEERRQKVESLVRGKIDGMEQGQGTYQDIKSDESVEVSLQDLCSLLKPTTQFPKLRS